MSQNDINPNDKVNKINNSIIKKFQNLEDKFINITKDIRFNKSEIKYKKPVNIYL